MLTVAYAMARRFPIVLGSALFVELNYGPPVWVHIIAWPLMILALGLPALRMVKGVLIALTYHNRHK